MRDGFVQVRLQLFSLRLLKHLVADFVEHVDFLKETDRPLDALSNMTQPMSFCIAWLHAAVLCGDDSGSLSVPLSPIDMR